MDLWKQCVAHLQGDLTSAEFNTWILPLQARMDGPTLRLLAPNKFVRDWGQQHYEERIRQLCARLSKGSISSLRFEIGGIDGNRTPATARRE